MNKLREVYEKETGEKWDTDGVHNPSLSYLEWLEDKVYVCEYCKFNDTIGIKNICRTCEDYNKFVSKT